MTKQPVLGTLVKGGEAGGPLMQPIEQLASIAPQPSSSASVQLQPQFQPLGGGGGVERTIPLWGVRIAASCVLCPGGWLCEQ